MPPACDIIAAIGTDTLLQRSQTMRYTGLETLFIADLHAAAWRGPSSVDAAGNTAADFAIEIHTARRFPLRAAETHLKRAHLHKCRRIKAALLRLLPVKRNAVIRAARSAALADGRIDRHGSIN
jgi:hypothetical protein